MSDLVRQRYGDPEAAPLASSSPAIEVQLAHRSVRRFAPEPVSEADLTAIVTAAQSAPTSSNLQCWSVVAVREPARLARLAELAGEQQFIAEAPLFLVWIADLARVRAVAERSGGELAGADYVETTLVAVIDAALAAQNAVVAAESLGLGTVYVGAVRNRPEEIAAELALPHHSFAVVGLAVGHPARPGVGRVKPRLPQQAVLHREQYDAESQLPLVDVYDERVAEFYASQRLGADWSARVTQRLTAVEALSGRERLSEALAALGLSLR